MADRVLVTILIMMDISTIDQRWHTSELPWQPWDSRLFVSTSAPLAVGKQIQFPKWITCSATTLNSQSLSFWQTCAHAWIHSVVHSASIIDVCMRLKKAI